MNRQGLEGYLTLYPHQVNSDMFPILKLQAPQARFQNLRVTDFNDLGGAPWPIIRHLGGPAPRAEAAAIAAHRLPLSSFHQSAEANRIFTALVEGREHKGGDVVAFNGLQVDSLRGLAASCKLGSLPERDTSLIFALATETTAYLDPERLRRMWGKPEWLSCKPTDEMVATALDFVAAVTEARNQDVLTLGQALLEGERGTRLFNDGVSGFYIFGAMQYAALSAGDREIARQLVEGYWGRLDQKSQGDASMRLLAYLALQGGVSEAH